MASRGREQTKLYKITIPLATSAVGNAGDQVAVVGTTHTAGPASGVTNGRALGAAVEDYSQTAGDTVVEVRLDVPVNLEWFDNDSTGIVLANDFLAKCYFKTPSSVTKTTNSGGVNYALAGIIWDVDATRGVGVQMLTPALVALTS